jgi:hypothetical protein
VATFVAKEWTISIGAVRIQETEHARNGVNWGIKFLQAIGCGNSVHGDCFHDSLDLKSGFDGRSIGCGFTVISAKAKEAGFVVGWMQMAEIG